MQTSIGFCLFSVCNSINCLFLVISLHFCLIHGSWSRFVARAERWLWCSRILNIWQQQQQKNIAWMHKSKSIDVWWWIWWCQHSGHLSKTMMFGSLHTHTQHSTHSDCAIQLTGSVVRLMGFPLHPLLIKFNWFGFDFTVSVQIAWAIGNCNELPDDGNTIFFFSIYSAKGIEVRHFGRVEFGLSCMLRSHIKCFSLIYCA